MPTYSDFDIKEYIRLMNGGAPTQPGSVGYLAGYDRESPQQYTADGKYIITPTYDGTGYRVTAHQHTGTGGYAGGGSAAYNGVGYDEYDRNGNLLNGGNWEGLGKSGLDKFGAFLPLLGAGAGIAAAGFGGAAAGGAAGSAGGAAGGAAGAGAAEGAMAGMDALYGGFAADTLGTMGVAPALAGGAAGAAAGSVAGDAMAGMDPLYGGFSSSGAGGTMSSAPALGGAATGALGAGAGGGSGGGAAAGGSLIPGVSNRDLLTAGGLALTATGGGSADTGLGQMQAAEDQRQAKIQASVDAINRTFGLGGGDKALAAKSGRDAMYGDISGAVRDTAMRDLDRQYGLASKRNKFGLARSGLLGGSVDAEAGGELKTLYGEGSLRATEAGQKAGSDLRLADERTRQNLISLAQTGLDTGTAESMAAGQMAAASDSAKADAAGATVGRLFDDMGQAYLQNQMLKARYPNGMQPQQPSGYSTNLFSPSRYTGTAGR